MSKLNPKKVYRTPHVMNVEVLLQIILGSKNTNVITPSQNNVIHVDYKNEKTTLSLLSEHSGIDLA